MIKENIFEFYVAALYQIILQCYTVCAYQLEVHGPKNRGFNDILNFRTLTPSVFALIDLLKVYL